MRKCTVVLKQQSAHEGLKCLVFLTVHDSRSHRSHSKNVNRYYAGYGASHSCFDPRMKPHPRKAPWRRTYSKYRPFIPLSLHLCEPPN